MTELSNLVQSSSAFINQISCSRTFTKVIASPGGALVKFYAPWCGYCTRFEGPYSDAAQALANIAPELIVARIDVTRFPTEASFAQIRGYPTVLLFIRGKSYNFNGERTVHGIVTFVENVLGPPVKELANADALKEKVEEHYDAVFFLYYGLDSGILWEAYNATAEEYRLQLPFYHLKEQTEVGEIFVYKDGGRRLLESKKDIDIQQHIENFVEQNRNPAFGYINAYDLRHTQSDGSSLVCVFLVDYLLDSTDAFKKIGRELAFTNFNPSSNIRLKFVWTVDALGLSSLAMTDLESPNILLFFPANHTIMLHPFYSQPEKVGNLKKPQITDFLIDAINGRIPMYGGRGWLIAIRRFCFDFRSACINMIQTSPFVALITFGVPLSCLSCLVYCICCAPGEDLNVPEEALPALGPGARKVRMFDRRQAEEQLASAKYEDASRARSIYSRNAARSKIVESTIEEPNPTVFEESRKDR
nr:protein disulfide isomerase TMX3 [Hymenolepis microstoma]